MFPSSTYSHMRAFQLLFGIELTVYSVVKEITDALHLSMKSCINDDEAGLLEKWLIVNI